MLPPVHLALVEDLFQEMEMLPPVDLAIVEDPVVWEMQLQLQIPVDLAIVAVWEMQSSPF